MKIYKFIFLNVKLLFQDVYFILFLVSLLSLYISSFFGPLGFLLRQSGGFNLVGFNLFVAYVASILVVERVLRVLPVQLTARGLLTSAAVVYIAISPLLFFTSVLDPAALTAPLLASLRRTPTLLLLALIPLAVLRPYGAAAILLLEVLSRIRWIGYVRLGAERMSSLSLPVKALVALIFALAYLLLRNSSNVAVYAWLYFSIQYIPGFNIYQKIVFLLFELVMYLLLVGIAFDTYLDSYLRDLYLFGPWPSLKPLYTVLWILAVTAPLSFFTSFNLALHLAIVLVLAMVVWSLKPNLYKAGDAMIYLVGLFVAGYIAGLGVWLLVVLFPLLVFLPKLAEAVRHAIATATAE
jgi:hypothetical protein